MICLLLHLILLQVFIITIIVYRLRLFQRKQQVLQVEQQKVQKGPVAGGLASGVHGQKPVVDHHKVEEREHGLSKGVEIGDDIVARYEGERGQWLSARTKSAAVHGAEREEIATREKGNRVLIIEGWKVDEFQRFSMNLYTYTNTGSATKRNATQDDATQDIFCFRNVAIF